MLKITSKTPFFVVTIVASLSNTGFGEDTSLQKLQIVDKSIAKPDVFVRFHEAKHTCDSNALVSAWCGDSATKVLTEVECGLLPEFDEYGCTCFGDPTQCPTECIGGTEPLEKTHFGIRCGSIPPTDEIPNYILKEKHLLHRCENNLLVSAWCDDYINRHLECGLYIEADQYLCRCSGKATNCPDECIDGAEPIVRTSSSVLCSGIPIDSPNYVLKSTVVKAEKSK